MKIKAIERLCKANANIVLCDEPTVDVELPPRQWMGDGVALYPLDGVPRLDEGGVMAIFDIDAKKREKIRLTHKDHLPALIGVGATAMCLMVFSKDIFLIPSMAMVAILLTISRKTGRRETHA